MRDAIDTNGNIVHEGEECPDCMQNELVEKCSLKGCFIACSGFPFCRFTASYTKKIGNV